MSEDLIFKNFNNYKNGLIKLFGEEIAEAIIEALGGEEKVAKAPYLNLANSGAAYDGAFIKNVIRLTHLAHKINAILPEEIQADIASINKVCMLSQIAKVLLYEENDNRWEIANRGMIYKYAQLNGALRVGERSTMIASNVGVKFTEEEYEAMRIMDKSTDDDAYTKYFSSPLSLVIRQASEIIAISNTMEYAKQQN